MSRQSENRPRVIVSDSGITKVLEFGLSTIGESANPPRTPPWPGSSRLAGARARETSCVPPSR